MAYTITYNAETWQPLGTSFYQTVHQGLDGEHSLLVILECTPPNSTPHVYEAAIYYRDGYEWKLRENVDAATVLVCEETPLLQERVYGA